MPSYHCPVDGCPYSCQYSKDLRRHLNSGKHNAVKSFNCALPDCDYFFTGFSRKDTAKRHMQNKHRHSTAAVIDLNVKVKPAPCDSLGEDAFGASSTVFNTPNLQ